MKRRVGKCPRCSKRRELVALAYVPTVQHDPRRAQKARPKSAFKAVRVCRSCSPAEAAA